MPFKLLVFILLIASVSFAQPAGVDTAFVASAKQNTKNLYNQFITSQSQLYRGSDYHKYVPTEDEHPYFMVNDWKEGTITYDGEYYENIPLLYDMFKDKVIIENYGSNNEMVLVEEKIEQFTINKHIFIHLLKNKTTYIKEGYYDLLYDGTLKFYVKREKSLQTKIRTGKIYNYFVNVDNYYIMKNGMYFNVKTKKSVLDLLNERGQDLKQFLSKNKIHFTVDREYAIKLMVEFIDTTKN